MAVDAYHELLTTRYVCEACLTRYFVKYRRCFACRQVGTIRLLNTALNDLADNDQELRHMIAGGQTFQAGVPGEDQNGKGSAPDQGSIGQG